MSALWGVIIRVIDAVVGFVLSRIARRSRDRGEAERETRQLAGTLAAELEGFKAICPSDENVVVSWAAEQSYTPVYDSSGSHLYVLGHDLLKDVATCYSIVKRALDECHRAQLMTRDLQLHPYDERGHLKRPAQQHGQRAREAAVARSQEATKHIDSLLPRLIKASQ